jgi:lipoprotein YgeR
MFGSITLHKLTGILMLSFLLAGPPVSAQDKASSKTQKTPAHTASIRYRVLRGDTLYSIARSFGVSVASLYESNNLKKKSIREGDVITIRTGSDGTSRKTGKSAAGHLNGNTDEIKNNASSKPVFAWPLKNVCGIESDARNGVKGIGIKIQGKPGAAVVSSADGLVKRVGYMRGFGNYVMILHGGKYMTVYANLGEIQVREGDIVSSGVIIARLDMDDSVLHFQVNNSGRPLDAKRLLGAR